jgi:hypothetical protein
MTVAETLQAQLAVLLDARANGTRRVRGPDGREVE